MTPTPKPSPEDWAGGMRTLCERLRRYAEIQDDTETRKLGMKATNTWASGFREAATALEQQAAEIERLREAARQAVDTFGDDQCDHSRAIRELARTLPNKDTPA